MTSSTTKASGFSEQAMRDLEGMEAARFPPMTAYSRTTAEVATGKRAADRRPHYWGHRERLRSRFMKSGSGALPEYEILELILFNGIPRVDVKPLAKELLSIFGDLSGVIAASEARLLAVQGMTERAVVQLRLAADVAARMGRARVIDREVLNSWNALMEYCTTVMAHRETEQFRVLFMNQKFELIADEAQAEGTVNHVPVYTREVVKRALELNASAIILVHNHPSGDPTPSEGDVEMTAAIAAALATVDIRLQDHVIVGRRENVSFRALGLI